MNQQQQFRASPENRFKDDILLQQQKMLFEQSQIRRHSEKVVKHPKHDLRNKTRPAIAGQISPTNQSSYNSGQSLKITKPPVKKTSSLEEMALMIRSMNLSRSPQTQCEKENDSRILSENNEMNECISKLVQKCDKSDSKEFNIGAIQMKLTHFRKRVRPRHQSARQRNLLNAAKVEGLLKARRIRPNFSGQLFLSHQPLQQSVNKNEDTIIYFDKKSDHKRKKKKRGGGSAQRHRVVQMKLPTSESWITNIDLKKVGQEAIKDDEKHKRAYRQINTLVLSERSHGTVTADLPDISQSCKVDIEEELQQSTPTDAPLEQSIVQSAAIPETNSETAKVEVQIKDETDRQRIEEIIAVEIKKIQNMMTETQYNDPIQLSLICDQANNIDRKALSLRQLQENLKQQMRHNMQELGRPILSTRQSCRNMLARRAIQEKEQQLLKSQSREATNTKFSLNSDIFTKKADQGTVIVHKNQKDVQKYYVSLATVMEHLNSPNNYNVPDQPRECFILTPQRDQISSIQKIDPNTDNVTSTKGQSQQQTLLLEGNTIDLLSQTNKSSALKHTNSRTASQQKITSAFYEVASNNKSQMFFEKKSSSFGGPQEQNTSALQSEQLQKQQNMKIEVRNECKSDLSLVPSSDAMTHDMSKMSSRPQIRPKELDINTQDFVTVGIADHNQQIVETRKKMAAKRNSRTDTLNQLVTPRNEFEMTHRSFASNKMKLMQTMSEQQNSNKNASRQPNADLPSTGSNQSYERQIKLQTQGGGFNRSLGSGYFKGKQRRSQTTEEKICLPGQSQKTLMIRKKQKQKKPFLDSNKPVVVEERPQILANEVWSSQNRGMPLKLVFQVQKPSSKQYNLSNKSVIRETNSKPQSYTALSEPSMPEATKIEIFPFTQKQKEILPQPTQSSALIETQSRNTEQFNSEKKLSPTLQTDSTLQKIYEAAARKDRFVSSHRQLNQQPYLSAINEHFSEGQYSASNGAIVEFRFSKQSKITYGVQESTVRLHASQKEIDGNENSMPMKANLSTPEADNGEPHKGLDRIKESVKRSQDLMINHRNHLRMLNLFSDQIKSKTEVASAEKARDVQSNSSADALEERPPKIKDHTRGSSEKIVNYSILPKTISEHEEIIKSVGKFSKIVIDSEGDKVNYQLTDGNEKPGERKTGEIYMRSAEEAMSAYEKLEQHESGMVKIADLKKINADNSERLVITPSHFSGVVNEAQDGPQRRSVLQKSTVKTPSGSRHSAKPDSSQFDYRMKLSTNPNGISNQVLVKDLRIDDEAVDSETQDEAPQPIFADNRIKKELKKFAKEPENQLKAQLQNIKWSEHEKSQASRLMLNSERSKLNNYQHLAIAEQVSGEPVCQVWQKQFQQQRPKTTKALHPSKLLNSTHHGNLATTELFNYVPQKRADNNTSPGNATLTQDDQLQNPAQKPITPTISSPQLTHLNQNFSKTNNNSSVIQRQRNQLLRNHTSTASHQSSWRMKSRGAFTRSSRQNLLDTFGLAKTSDLSQQAKDIGRSMKLVQSQSSRLKSSVRIQPQQQSPGMSNWGHSSNAAIGGANPQRKKLQGRKNFTQGVSELIRNFDKNFIVQNVILPQPPSSTEMVKTQQKQIVERTQTKRSRGMSGEQDANSKENVYMAMIQANQMQTVPSLKETVTRTISHDDHTTQHLDSPVLNTSEVQNSSLGTKRHNCKLAQLSTSSRPASKMKMKTKISRMGSPIAQKTFDGDDKLTQVHPTFFKQTTPGSAQHRAQFHVVRQTDSSKSPISVAFNNAPVKIEVSKKQQTGQKSAGQSQLLETVNRNLLELQRWRKKVCSQKNPLKFLANQPALNLNEDLMSSRNDGLIIQDRRKYQLEPYEDVAQVENSQNIVININSSLIRNSSALPKERRKRNHLHVNWDPSAQSIAPNKTAVQAFQEQHEIKNLSEPFNRTQGVHKIRQIAFQQTANPQAKSKSLPKQQFSELQNYPQPKNSIQTRIQNKRRRNFTNNRVIEIKETNYEHPSRNQSSDQFSYEAQQRVGSGVSSHSLPFRAATPSEVSSTRKSHMLKQSYSMGLHSGLSAVQQSTLKQFQKNAIQNQMPTFLEKYSKNVQMRVNQGQNGRLSLTQDDIEMLFKDLRSAQKKSLNRSSAVLSGTQVQQNR